MIIGAGEQGQREGRLLQNQEEIWDNPVDNSG